MSKYNRLWEYVGTRTEASFLMTFDEIAEKAGIPLDHSFLSFKKELAAFGYQVGKISMKNKTVSFEKL